MHVNRSLNILLRRTLRIAPVCAALVVPSLQAQSTATPAPTAAQLAKYDKNNNGKLDEDEVAAMNADAAGSASSSAAAEGADVVTLSPFEITDESTNGYQASATMSGTRLNAKLEDLAASITVITKQQIQDTASTDINDLFKYEANTEGIYQYTEWSQDRGYTIDNVAQNPATANRIRGANNANIANSNFVSSVPVDAYNLDSAEISRGPNSNIFGLGNASGTVNLIPSAANPTRSNTSTGFRVDSYGGFRTTYDINRPIIKDKLAVRVIGLYENKGYERKPSYERTQRITGAITFKPVSTTTLKASFEGYHNYNNRPNSVTPRDTISDWKRSGSPVWDPTYQGVGGWRLLNSSTYRVSPIQGNVPGVTPVVGANENSGPWSLPPGLGSPGSGFYARSALFIDNGQFAYWTINRATTTVNSPGAQNSNLRYVYNFGQYQRTNYTDYAGNFHNLTPLYQQPGINDDSLYDWESINFAAPNFGREKADSYKVELEQWFIKSRKQVLAAQIGWYREDIDRYSRNWVGNTDGAPPVVVVDVNEKLLDGTANPFFLKPFIPTSEVQAFRQPEVNDNYRGTLAYQVDFRENEGWSKYLGHHSLAGYMEHRQIQTVTNRFRYRDEMVTGPYTNLTNLSAAGNFTHFASRYYVGGRVTDPGPMVDYNARWVDYHGTYPLTWWQPGAAVTEVGAKVVENIDIGEAFFSTQNVQQRSVNTRGLIWQGFFLDDRIIPTYGVRMDSVTSISGDNQGGDATLNPLTRQMEPRFTFNEGRNSISRSGRTTTKGIVVKPLRWLNLHYNTSNNFLPESAAYTITQQLLPNPTGTGKDYGFTVNLIENKLSVRFNRYETFQKNSRNGTTGVLATRPLRIDFDTSASNTNETQDLEDAAIVWTTELKYGANTFFNPTYGTANISNGALGDLNGATINVGTGTGTSAVVLATLDKTAATALINEAYTKYMGPNISTAYVDWVRTSGVTLGDVNDITSKGNEVEINYNPNKFWTLKGNITQQKAVDTNISATIGEYIGSRIDWWQGLLVPTGLTPSYVNPSTSAVVAAGPLPFAGQSWFLNSTGISGSNGNPRDFYIGNVDAVYTFAVDNAGKPRPQAREWRVNMTTNYRLAGLSDISWLKNATVGGTVRWEDKARIGYKGKPASIDGIQRYRDPEQPFFDKSRYYLDLKASYRFKMFDKVNATLQLNINNVFENGRLQAVAVNPDGQPWNFRIIDPRQFIMQANFDF